MGCAESIALQLKSVLAGGSPLVRHFTAGGQHRRVGHEWLQGGDATMLQRYIVAATVAGATSARGRGRGVQAGRDTRPSSCTRL